MPSGTIKKTIQLLRFMIDKGMYLPLREISSEMNIPKSTLHRICQALTNEGILELDAAKKQYRWGPELIYIAQCVYQSKEIRRLAIPVLKKIVDHCHETAQLIIYDQAKRKITFIDEVQSIHPIRYHTPIGVPLPIHAGASGKAIMAFLPEDEIEAIIASGLPKITSRTIIRPERLRQALRKIRATGYSVAYGERTVGAVGSACPIFDSSAKVIGGLVVTIPEYRFRPEMENSIVRLVREESEHLSRLMGLPEDSPYPPKALNTTVRKDRKIVDYQK